MLVFGFKKQFCSATVVIIVLAQCAPSELSQYTHCLVKFHSNNQHKYFVVEDGVFITRKFCSMPLPHNCMAAALFLGTDCSVSILIIIHCNGDCFNWVQVVRRHYIIR
jgi:hypothetical protein